MSKNRKGEEDQGTKFRSDRFIHNGEKWFYETREGSTEGPFRTRLDAEDHLRNYVKLLNSGWWNGETDGLTLEPVKTEPEPSKQQESQSHSKTWAVRRNQ